MPRPCGMPWRRRRKELHQFCHPNAVAQYQPLQQREVVKFLKKLLEKPDTFLHQIRQYVPPFLVPNPILVHRRNLNSRFTPAVYSSFASTIMRISYGIQVEDENDQYVTAVETGVATFNEAFVPGAFLVETFPILKHIPDWFPGASFKRTVAAWKDIAHNMRDAPFEKTMESWVRCMTRVRCGYTYSCVHDRQKVQQSSPSRRRSWRTHDARMTQTSQRNGSSPEMSPLLLMLVGKSSTPYASLR